MVPEWRPQPTHRKPALHIVSMHHETPWLANRNGRLPSSKPAVSNLKLWCTLRFMHVGARPALNQLGITEGNMAKKAKKAKKAKSAVKKTAKKTRKVAKKKK